MVIKSLLQSLLVLKQDQDVRLNLSETLWVNYVPRKMPDVRSWYASYTNMRRLIYPTACYTLFMLRRIYDPKRVSRNDCTIFPRIF